ncbi:hypothetical protein E6H34_01870 [Candidatus Bathyarchaeota archaeon]|nr:MAG: hypothetical protein E6H34_01870 [Candidatus Bathyarchaeota archaeon]
MEIVASMRRATLKNGQGEWHETCYPPFQHERATVYDRFFTGVQVEPAEAASQPAATSFWAYLRKTETSQPDASTDSTLAGPMYHALGRNTV